MTNPAWTEGQTLYRLSWAPRQGDHNQQIRVTEYTVDRVTPAGGWIYETDTYTGEKPDRSKGNMRPHVDDTRIWRRHDSNFVHATGGEARRSLEARTRRHMKIVWAEVARVHERCRLLGIDAEKQKPSPFLMLRSHDS